MQDSHEQYTYNPISLQINKFLPNNIFIDKIIYILYKPFELQLIIVPIPFELSMGSWFFYILSEVLMEKFLYQGSTLFHIRKEKEKKKKGMIRRVQDCSLTMDQFHASN